MSRCDLFPSAEALLADIRFYPYQLPFSDRPASQFAAEVMNRGKSVLNKLGLPMVQYQCGLNLLKALARVFRSFQGEELARELELLWLKWDGAGMAPDLTRAITSGAYQSLTGRPHGGESAAP